MTKDLEDLEDLKDLREELEELKKRKEELDRNDNMEEYEEMLDSLYGEVTVANMTFSTSYALKELDPIAFNCGHSDFNSELISEIEDEIETKEIEVKEMESRFAFPHHLHFFFPPTEKEENL